MHVSVRNGTHAGWRKTRVQNRTDWTCPGCGKLVKYYWLRCPNDNHPRPEE